MKLDKKKYPSLAAVLYPLGELVLSLIGSKKVFDAELKAKVEAKEIKVEIDGEKMAIPAKVKSYEAATLPVEEDADREWVITLTVPNGQEDKYLKGLKSVLKGFKVERLPSYRKPKALIEAAAGEQWIITDWANNVMFNEMKFDSFEAGEAFLSEKLGEAYEEERGEYEIIPDKGTRDGNYLDPKDPRGGKKANAAKPAAKGKTVKHTEEHETFLSDLRECLLPLGDLKDKTFKDKALKEALPEVQQLFQDLDDIRERLAKEHGIVENKESVFYDDAVAAGWTIEF